MKLMHCLLAVALNVTCADVAAAGKMSPEAEYNRISKYCYRANLAKYESENCYSEQVQRLKSQLDRAIRQQLFEIGEIFNESKQSNLNNGADLDSWRDVFNNEQAAWESYFQKRCENIISNYNEGGSGSGGRFFGCQIRLMLQRLQEITDSRSN